MSKQFRFPARAAIALTGWLFLACGKDSTSTTRAGRPAQLNIVSGDAQSGTVGKELAQALVIKVVDANGRPVEGQLVNFRVTAGGGSVFAGSANTNDEGVAQERWTLGTVAGVDQAVEARAVDNSTGQAIVFATFHASAMADAPSALSIVRQPSTSAQSGRALETQPAVRVTDKYGNPTSTSGAQVTAAIAAPTNGRTVTGTATVATDNSGAATFTNLIVAGSTGLVTLSFTASGLTPVASNAITLAAGAPAQLVAVTPTSLTGTAGASIAPLPMVIVRDAAGNPVAGVSVVFALSDGGGTISPTSLTTDANGQAALSMWALPKQAGTARVVASASAIPNVTVVFSVAVAPGAASHLTRIDNTNLTATVGTTLPIGFRVADDYGNAVSGATVAFSVGVNSGSVSTNNGTSAATATATSDATGSVNAAWTLGTLAGQQTLTVSLGGTTTTLSATAQPGPSSQLQKVAGDGQTGAAGAALLVSPSVRVLDASGNSISGVSVTFAVVAGGGSVSGSTATTDASGIAAVQSWTLGSALGENDLSATAGGMTVTFVATAVAGAPTIVSPVSGSGQSGTVGSQLPNPLVVSVTDGFGNPTPGATVHWSVVQGAAALSSATTTTDAAGRSSITVTLPTTSGAQSVRAALENGHAVQFSLTANPGPLASLVKLSGDAQTGPVNSTLPAKLCIRSVDQYGNAVQTTSISWTTTSGMLTPSSGTTAVDGSLCVSWTFGSTAGSQSATANAGTVQTTFTATATQSTGVVASLSPAQSNPTSATVGSSVTLGVMALDANGVAIAGVPIAWSVAAGGGTISPASSTTDASGVAVATAKLSNVAGANAFQAAASNSTGVAPLTLTVTGTPGRACNFVYSNQYQTGVRGDILPLPLRVAAYDSLNNPVPNENIPVQFDYHEVYYPDVNGSVSTIRTDATGLSSTGGTMLLGSHIGVQHLLQTVRPCFWGLAPWNGIQFGGDTATATPITHFTPYGGTSGSAGSIIPYLGAIGLDRHDFYVPGAPVTFTVTAGDGTFQGGLTSVQGGTNGTGVATTVYTVGSSSLQQVTVSAPGATPLTITITRSP